MTEFFSYLSNPKLICTAKKKAPAGKAAGRPAKKAGKKASSDEESGEGSEDEDEEEPSDDDDSADDSDTPADKKAKRPPTVSRPHILIYLNKTHTSLALLSLAFTDTLVFQTTHIRLLYYTLH